MRLYSKRNEVYRYFNLVIKKVCDKKSAKFEYGVLKELLDGGVVVPKPYFTIRNFIFMRYIKSETVVDVVENSDTLTIETAAKLVCLWLFEFYNLFEQDTKNVILDDVNCRNFLYNKDGKQGAIYGVDFETLTMGDKRENLAEIVEFIESCDIKQHKKTSFKNSFLNEVENIFNISELELEPFLKSAKQKIESRRQHKQNV